MARYSKAQREAQSVEALKLWMSENTYRDIADHLGIPTMTAYDRVQQALDQMRPHADFSRYRAVQLAELEIARRPLRLIASTWEPPADHRQLVDAIGALVKLQEREAKLVGLDSVPTAFDELLAMTDEELGAMVAEWANDG